MVYLVQLSIILQSKCLHWGHVIHVFNPREINYVCQANKTQQFCIACNSQLPTTITAKVQEGSCWRWWRACCEVSNRDDSIWHPSVDFSSCPSLLALASHHIACGAIVKLCIVYATQADSSICCCSKNEQCIRTQRRHCHHKFLKDGVLVPAWYLPKQFSKISPHVCSALWAHCECDPNVDVSFGSHAVFSYVLAGTIASSSFRLRAVAYALQLSALQWLVALVLRLWSLDLASQSSWMLVLASKVEFPNPRWFYYIRSIPRINMRNGHPDTPMIFWSLRTLRLHCAFCHKQYTSGTVLLDVCSGNLNEFAYQRLIRKRRLIQLRKQPIVPQPQQWRAWFIGFVARLLGTCSICSERWGQSSCD